VLAPVGAALASSNNDGHQLLGGLGLTNCDSKQVVVVGGEDRPLVAVNLNGELNLGEHFLSDLIKSDNDENALLKVGDDAGLTFNLDHGLIDDSGEGGLLGLVGLCD